MRSETANKKDRYYSTDHEWIDFEGALAYVGISKFKLTGFKEIGQVIYHATSGLKKKGETIATLKYQDFQVDVNMPVDGKIIETNPAIIYNDAAWLPQNAETAGWIAHIAPSQPNERNGLLLPGQYHVNVKSEYAK